LDIKENKKMDISNINSDKEKNLISQPRGSDNELAIKYYYLARELCVKKDYKNALTELEKAVKIDPKFEQAHILLSRTYIKLKNDGLIYVKE
jgi:Tfp pilus assembly protein PilF